MTHYDKVTHRDLKYPGLALLSMADRLKKKLQKILLANSLPLQMFGIGRDEYTAKARHIDPKTAIAVLQNVYEPKRKSVFADCRILNRELHDFTVLLQTRAFMIENHELDELMLQFMQLDDRVNNLMPKVYEQAVTQPFKAPNPMDIVRIRNRFVPSVRNDYDPLTKRGRLGNKFGIKKS